MKLLCPTCGDDVPADSVWLVRGKLYCSMEHARNVAQGYPPAQTPALRA